MKKIFIISTLAVCALAFRYTTGSRQTENYSPDGRKSADHALNGRVTGNRVPDVRTAAIHLIAATPGVSASVQKSLNLLAHSSQVFLHNTTCFSCHGQCLSSVAFALASEKGYKVEDGVRTEIRDRIDSVLHASEQGYIGHSEAAGANITLGYALWALSSAQVPAGKTTAVVVNYLIGRQNQHGYWLGGNGRPPVEYYSFTATALAMYSIQHYGPPGFKDRIDEAVKRASPWLAQNPAVNNEEKVWQLLGLHWIHADPELIRQKAQKLLDKQRFDGGWSQLDSLQTDAYATGQALYALCESGALLTTDKAYQDGMAFLLRTQYPDGSWRVKTRSFPVVEYVYSGFPFGDEQFISAAGTNWAVMALLMAAK
jgi:N-acyl-D-amino-acid deacylase